MVDGFAMLEMRQLFEQRREINTRRHIVGLGGFNQAIQHGAGFGTQGKIVNVF